MPSSRPSSLSGRRSSSSREAAARASTFPSFGPVVAYRAAAAVLIGESGPELQRLFRDSGLGHTRRAATLDAAVRIADDLARGRLAAGDPAPATVLLSPAAASFDMFADYEARGRAFKESVGRLAAERRDRNEP